MERDRSKYRELFVHEAHEHIQNLNQLLLKLEEEPEAHEHLDGLFRSAHTLKGMGATLGYDQIVRLSRAVEETFDRIRKGEAKPSTHLVNSLFKCFDALEETVDDESKKVNMEMLLRGLQSTSGVEGSSETKTDSRVPIQLPAIRVKMSDLDTLVNLVGELATAKMRLDQLFPRNGSDEIREAMAHVGRLVSELHDHSMRIRLVSTEQIFNRFPRMVRDLSREQGKQVNLELEGGEIEVDRTVLDAITDPLLHLLRNAVDHGIEAPSERKKFGKAIAGTIRMATSRVRDRVAIRVQDDGRGIDIEKIKATAVEKKIVSSEKAGLMTDEEVVALLGTPGLTETERATDVSGRGVGLNVVRSQVEKVGGQVKIETKKGVGTTMTLVVPVSLAIIRGLLVTVADENYILPLSSINNVVRVDSTEIKSVQGRPALMLRGIVVPLVLVGDALGITKSNDLNTGGARITVVVVDKGGKPYGLVVDSVGAEYAVVIKKVDNAGAFSNATILPDGRVVLMLDPAVLI